MIVLMSVATAVTVVVIVLFAIAGFVGLFRVLFIKSGGPIGKYLVAAPDGIEYFLTVRQGPGGDRSRTVEPRGYWHLWAVLRRDRTWWVDVETSQAVPWPVLREPSATELLADARVAELLVQIRTGPQRLSTRPALLRRPNLVTLRRQNGRHRHRE
jgi:hypothetical protein